MSETEHTDQRWFWTEDWQSGEREANAAIAAGETTVFDSDEDFVAALADIDAAAAYESIVDAFVEVARRNMESRR